MTQLREEFYFTKGRVIVRGKTVKRGEAKKADYLLFYRPNIPIAVIEAKDNNHSVGAGMQQALEYAEILDVPFVYSSNGDGFLEHDRTVSSGAVEREFPLHEFPAPDELFSISWFEGGEVFRSGCTWRRGKGRVVYFSPGHETFPIYHDPHIQLILANAVRYAAPNGATYFGEGRNIPQSLSPISSTHVADESLHRKK